MDSKAVVAPQASHALRRSCLVCSAAKVKCTLPAAGSHSGAEPCGRCRRLGKECVMQTITPRKPRTRKRTTRVAQLEQKLDDLMQLLTAKDHEHLNYPSPESASGRVVPHSPLSRALPAVATGEVMVCAASTPSFLAISDDYAQECFERYKLNQMPAFPFVVLPPPLTARELRDKRPALFGSIIVAASFRHFESHLKYGEDLLRYLTDAILIRGEKNVELLQALLIYTAWYHNVLHFKKRVTHLASMLSVLVTDLGLARASSVNERLTLTIEETQGSYGCTSSSGVRTLEERRTYLGAFYISSSISATFRDLNALRRSAYLEDCCKALERATESPSDRFLISLLRLQNHVERAAHTFQYSSLELHSRHNWRVPLTLYMVPLQKDLEAFRNNLPPDLQNDHIMMLNYWSAMAYLFEFSLYEPMQKSYFGQPCFRRMEYLYACLQAMKQFYAVLFNIPISDWYYMPLFTFTQITHGIMTLSKLCFLHAEDWNVTHAREESDFANLLERIALKMEEARAFQDQEAALATTDSTTGLERSQQNAGSVISPTDFTATNTIMHSPTGNTDYRALHAYLESREHASDGNHPSHRALKPPPADQPEDFCIVLPARLRIIKAKYEKKAAADAAALERQQEPTTFPVGPNHLPGNNAFDLMVQMEDEAFWQALMGATWAEGAVGDEHLPPLPPP